MFLFGGHPIRTNTKKDVGVLLLLTSNTGLGEPTREISNAQLAHVKDDMQYSTTSKQTRMTELSSQVDAPVAVSSSG